MIIGVVGVCGSGKTTLVNGLKPYGIDLKHIAQEHSYVPGMWQRLVKPDILIFLDASYPETIRRRRLNWTLEEYLEQQKRLAHARLNCHFYLFTDGLPPGEMIDQVVLFLQNRDVISKPAES